MSTRKEMKAILQKQLDAMKPYKSLPMPDFETRRTQYGEQFGISVDTTIDDNDEVVVMPVILFVPNVDDSAEHFHIELKDVRGLYEWLGKFLAVAESKSDYTQQDEDDYYAERASSREF